MYRNCPEHPDIDRTLRTGYPRSWFDEDEYDDFGLTGEEEEAENDWQ